MSGTVRLDQLKDHFGDQIGVTWRSFLLRTEPKAASLDKFIHYTKSWRRPAEMEPAVVFNEWVSGNEPPSSSVPAQVAAKSMEIIAPDLVDAFHHRLLSAYFTENQTISDWSVLGALAGEVGVGSEEFLSMTQQRDRALTEAVIADHNEATGRGVTGVPAMIFNDTFPIQGAQDFDSLSIWIQRLLDRQPA